ncbi:MAG: SusD/RagB family nutrient-binding outer membrane lipoprotein [Cyclobacteriaceae bacterium]|nr:SusD/RagB family nutrient-binding outer membrane lipoprotein [Cyclobacteriaceae bacterium]
MKKRVAIVLVLGSLCSCESFVSGVNEDDITRPQDGDLKLILTAAELHYMGWLESDVARLAGLWSGYFNGRARQSASYYSYNVTASTSNAWWNNAYAAALKSIRIAKSKAIQFDNLSTLGICEVMEASLMGTVAALWGDVPFKQATAIDEFPDPVYDLQTQIIDDLIVQLDSAVLHLQANSPRDGDFLNGPTGPINNWVLTAYSVKARLLLYRRDYVKALSAATNGIQSPANDLLGKHGASLGERNLYFNFQANSAWSGDMTANNTWLGGLLNATTFGNRNHAKTNESARRAKYYSGSSVATYLPNTGANGFFAMAASFPLHTAVETKLIAAECHARLGDPGNAIILLNQVRAILRSTYASGVYLDFVSTDFDSGGIENPQGTLPPNEALLREILEEKYVCLYGQVEAFNEIRRTNNALGIPPNTGTQHPQRLLYPLTEFNANKSIPNPIPGLFEKTTLFQ